MKQKTLGILILLSLTAVVVYSMARQPHDFNNNECTICHTEPNNGASARENSSSVTQKCLTCHTTLFDEGYMHPVDIKPKKVTLPLDFPLSKNGEITCNTCHDVHAPYETPFGTKSHFLRRNETGKVFCDICHINAIASATGHQTVFRKAHFDSKYTETDDIESIDSLSKDCLSCHDGAFASSVQVRAGVWKHANDIIKFDGGMHPIGMKYDRVQRENTKAALAPLSQVDKRIRFFGRDNKVGCGSCHNPFSAQRMKLVLSNENSRLCFCCHKM